MFGIDYAITLLIGLALGYAMRGIAVGALNSKLQHAVSTLFALDQTIVRYSKALHAAREYLHKQANQGDAAAGSLLLSLPTPPPLSEIARHEREMQGVFNERD